MASMVWQTGFERGQWSDLSAPKKSKLPPKFPSITVGVNEDPPWRFMRNFYIRHASFPKRRTVIMTLTTKNGPDYVIGYDSKAGRTFAGIGNKTELGPKPPLDEWYRLDILAKCKTTRGSLKWAVNGISSDIILEKINPTEFDRLIYGANPPTRSKIYWDDILLSPHAAIKNRRR